MSIDKILEYQEIDMEYLRLENQLRNSDEAKKLKECETQYKSSSDEVLKYNILTEDAFANIEKFEKQYSDLKKEIIELGSSVEEDTDPIQLDFYSKKLDQLLVSLESIQKESERLSNELKKIQESANTEMQKASKCMQLAKQFKDAYLKKQEVLSVQAKEIKIKRDAVEKDITPEIMDIYQKVRKNRKMPFFVEFVPPKTCKGCGMELANDSLSVLCSGNHVVECPNCGRIIFKKD